jgi:hypothetical protein
VTTHDAEFDIEESVTDAIPSVDGPIASFQPPQRRAAGGDRADDLQRAADRRAAEMREAAAHAAARLRGTPEKKALPMGPSPLDVESPFLELFDASAMSPDTVKLSGPPPTPPTFMEPPPLAESGAPVSAPPARGGYQPPSGQRFPSGQRPPSAPVSGAVLPPVSAQPLPIPSSAPPVPRHAARSMVTPPARSARQRQEMSRQLKPPKLKKDRSPSQELEITEIAGHLTFTAHAVTAWYLLPEVRWAFRPDPEREALLSAISEQYAGLAGFRLHLRRTTRPFPADLWAQQLDALTPRPLPSVAGAPGWGDHLVAAQRHLRQVNHAEGQTFLGVTFARRSLGDSWTQTLLKAFGKGTPEGERKKLGRQVEQFDEVLAAFGMRGQRAAAFELEWLLYRSVALGMSVPTDLGTVGHGHWEAGDLLALTEDIERYRTPYGSTVKLVNRVSGEERHVAVLTVGRMEPLDIPERHEPWLHFHERLPWAMEISTRVDILGPQDSFRNLEHRLRMIRSQQQDYLEHGIDAPPELERLASRALVMGDEMTTGLPVDSARAHGWHRIAVSGATRDECLERARALTAAYSRELRIALQHPKQQDQLAREFIPGEPIANTGYLRRMPVRLLSAALPQAASTVGDRRGDLIGRTAGTCRRPCSWTRTSRWRCGSGQAWRSWSPSPAVASRHCLARWDTSTRDAACR